MNPDSPVFRSSYQLGTGKVMASSTNAIKEIMRRLILKSGMRDVQVKTGRRYNKQTDHGFRKRFNTILKLNNDVNSNVAEKLMAHKKGLDGTYLQPTKEECFKEFSKAIEQLTIDPTQRQQIKIKSLEEDKSEIQTLKEKIERMEHYSKLNDELNLDRLKEAYGCVPEGFAERDEFVKL